ncbi:MAG TPA: ATP-grasp domain-containing protein [Gemmatimonadaceae bacterium]|nr:ATP-grasp domain-containing protein [Gemmatimonadaceae bacterium]
MPSDESFRRISDKAEVLRAAASVGLPIPMQRIAHSSDEARATADELEYPVVLKPSRSIGESSGQRRKQGVQHVASQAEFLSAVGALDHAAFPLLIQRRIVGPGVGVFLLVWDGETRAVFCHRRIREKPPSGGVSVYRESIAPNAALVERSRSLLDRFDWRGVAMVEYKVDAVTGQPFVMEVNGRFWGSLQLAIDAGVDFPALLIAAARHEDVPRTEPYAVGARSRWWWGDVDHLIARFRSADDDSFNGQMPSRRRALIEFLQWRLGFEREEVFRVDDPRPFLRETRQWFSRP